MRPNKPILLTLLSLLFFSGLWAQEENPFVVYDVPSQNLLKFNRFLINPTFSTVREDKSYVNLFHRNQSVSFDDNNQIYFLSYSGRVGDRSGVGLSLFTNREGLFNNFGVHANYAYGVRLSPKSNFTFGANFSYYQSAFNQNRANTVEDDPFLNSLESSSLITFQPGFNISFGQFDFGGFAENLFDYNLKNSESVTDFNEKTYSGHLQYTHQFKNGDGILEQGRLMPLARVRKVGEEPLTLGGSLVMDLPKLGWVQAGYDDFYGASAGLGFNLNKNLSIGYTVEKGLTNNFENFGVSHEVSLAYSFTPNLTEDRVLLEKDNDLVQNDKDVPQENLTLSDKDLEIAELQDKLAENDAILDELLFRQDSIEQTRKKDLERRFESVMKMVKRETQGERPDLESKARAMYFKDVDSTLLVSRPERQPLSNHGLTNTSATKRVIRLDKNSGRKVAQTPTSVKDRTTNTSNTPSAKSVRNYRSFDIPDVESGHYLIANVYREDVNLNRFLEELHDLGIAADYFVNPKNDLKYVYLEHSESKKQITDQYKTNLSGKFLAPMWVMSIKNDISSFGMASK
ncbi:MAG: type IX secretion system membrane protein PorP/SprF, partial [Bacteroidota bacterium]